MDYQLLSKAIESIQYGNTAEIKDAKKTIDKFLSDNRISLTKNNTELIEYLQGIFKDFFLLKKKNKIAFLSILKMFILEIEFTEDDFIYDFLIEAIQDSNGHIRSIAIGVFDYALMELDDNLTEDGTIGNNQFEMNRSVEKFGRLFMVIENLLSHYSENRFRKFKYITSFPPGVYKSLQYLIFNLREGTIRSAVI